MARQGRWPMTCFRKLNLPHWVPSWLIKILLSVNLFIRTLFLAKNVWIGIFISFCCCFEWLSKIIVRTHGTATYKSPKKSPTWSGGGRSHKSLGVQIVYNLSFWFCQSRQMNFASKQRMLERMFSGMAFFLNNGFHQWARSAGIESLTTFKRVQIWQLVRLGREQRLPKIESALSN